jgi:HEAT repeat protein
LKANPADPVVLSSLNLVADSRSPQAASMLLTIVKSSPNAKARKDAIFWLGRSRGATGDSTVDTLVSLFPTLSDDDAEAVIYSLSQIRSDKAMNAMVTIARDKSKSEKVRSNAAYWVGQSRGPNRVGLLQDIYKNSMDNAKVRQQITYALSQTRDAQAVSVMSNIAESDPDLEVRKNAVYWLGNIRSPEAGQALERLLLPQKK